MGALADTAVAQEFPTLDREGLVYLDSSATSQTPRTVIDAMTDYYENHRASVHRGVYPLQVEATELFEGARERIARFVNWGVPETILTRNASEALNLVAWSWGTANVGPGDRVVITEMEHHSVVTTRSPAWRFARPHAWMTRFIAAVALPVKIVSRGLAPTNCATRVRAPSNASVDSTASG